MIQEFLKTRAFTEDLCKPLEMEDFVIQPIEFVSPTKWHLAHTSWFFEVFILTKFSKEYELYRADYPYLFNSYYQTKRERIMKTDRGNLSRPVLQEVFNYRSYVTSALVNLLKSNTNYNELLSIVEIGIHHEKQHQELILMDIKYYFSHNPLCPIYEKNFDEQSFQEKNKNWHSIKEGLYRIGHYGKGFCYDNETKAHQVFLQEFEIRDGLVTNQEFLEFIENGGYENSLLWHDEAWDLIHAENINHPMYWQKKRLDSLSLL